MDLPKYRRGATEGGSSGGGPSRENIKDKKLMAGMQREERAAKAAAEATARSEMLLTQQAGCVRGGGWLR